MGFNWGAFAGGATEGFNNTYRMLKDEEERELIKEERRQALEAKRQSREAARDTIGRAGTEVQDQNLQTYGGMNPEQAKALDAQTAGMGDQAGIARQTIDSARYAQGAPDTAIPAELKGRTYSEAEAMADYGRRMAAIDPDKAIAARMGARQIRKMDREEKKDIELDELADAAGKRVSQIQSLSPDMGLYGLAQLAKKNGLAVEFQEAKDDTSPGKIIYTGPDGKKAEITSFADGQAALGQAAMMDYLTRSQLYVPPAQAMAMLKDRVSMQLAQRADNREELAAPGKRRLTEAQAVEAEGKGGYYASGTRLNNARIAELERDTDAKSAAKPFIDKYNALPQDQRDGAEGMALLDQAEAAVAFKSGDFSKIKASTPLGRINTAYQESAKAAAKEGLPPPNRVEFFAKAGYAPPVILQGQQQKVNELVRRGRDKDAQALIQQHNATFPHTKLTMPGPSRERQLIEAIPR